MVSYVTRHRRFRTAAALVGALLVVVGCESRSDLAQVSGAVRLDGQPLAEALVTFTPQGGAGVVSMGKTDGGGNYSLMATRSANGASLGANRVVITTHDILDLGGGKRQAVPEKVPTRYNTLSELRVTVQPGSNTFDFDLSTAGGKVVQTKPTVE